MILSGQSIRNRGILTPFAERIKRNGLTYGLGPAGYDIRIAQTILLAPGGFELGSTLEHFTMPNDLLAVVHDKSTWARQGLSVFNTVAEPGWEGFLTLELANRGSRLLEIRMGAAIAQVVFHVLDRPAERPYGGKYQHQGADPQPAILE